MCDNYIHTWVACVRQDVFVAAWVWNISIHLHGAYDVMINVSQESVVCSSAHAFKSIMRPTIATLRSTSMKSVCILPVCLMPWYISFFLFFFFWFISPDVMEVNNPPAGGHSFKLNFCPVGEASCEAVKGGEEGGFHSTGTNYDSFFEQVYPLLSAWADISHSSYSPTWVREPSVFFSFFSYWVTNEFTWM